MQNLSTLLSSLKLNMLTVIPSIEAAEGSNVFTDENGNLNSAKETMSNIEQLWENFTDKFMANLPKGIIFIILILLGIGVSKLVCRIVIKAFKKAGVDQSVYLFIKRIISFIINFAFILMALGLFININSFLAAIAACGVTIALGLQNSVAQFVSGIQILVTKQFKSGDYINVDGVEGSVYEIRFMNTVIHTVDNKRVIIPNSTMTSNKVINFSAEKTRRIDLIYSISYSTDIAKAKNVLLNTANKNEKVLKDPAAVVYVQSHESSSINLVARVWCKTEDYWDVYFSMQENVKLEFDKNEINIPFDQLDVHVTND